MSDHVHRWILGPQDGPVTVGRCACSATKEFLTAGVQERGGRDALAAVLSPRPPRDVPGETLITTRRRAFGTYRIGDR